MAAEKGFGRRRALGLPTVHDGPEPANDRAGDPACLATGAGVAGLLHGPNPGLVARQKDRFARLNEIRRG